MSAQLYHLRSLNSPSFSKHLTCPLNFFVLCENFPCSKNILNLNKQQSGCCDHYFVPYFIFYGFKCIEDVISMPTVIADFVTVMSGYCGQ